MRKKTALIALLLASLALAGCREDNDYKRESSSEITSKAHYESNSSDLQFAQDPISRDECVQIVALLKDLGELDYNIHPDDINSEFADSFPECVNAERFFDEEMTMRDGFHTYTERFYLIESGDFATEEGFNGKLDEMFTEGFKAQYFQSTFGDTIRFKDGEVYVARFGDSGITPPETVKLEIIEINENGSAITATAHDPRNDGSYSATLERSESGFKLAGVDDAFFALPELFRGSGVGVDIYFCGDFAFRV